MDAAARTPALLLLLLLLHVTPGRASGRVDIKLVRYVNVYGQDWKKDHCDSVWWGKSSECDFMFDLTFNNRKDGKGQQWPTIKSGIYRDVNTVEFGSSLPSGVRNPISKAFSSWQGVLGYHIFVVDDDHITGDDNVDKIEGHVAVAADNVERAYSLQGTVHGVNSKFVLTVRARCDLHFYGAFCEKKCVPRDDAYGHYKCDAHGNMVCLPDWRNVGRNCLEPDLCHAAPCKNGGRCEQVSWTAFRCYCPVQYHGSTCAVRKTPCELADRCQHGGRCVNVDAERSRCDCPSHREGAFCERDRNECAAAPCAHGGTCVNQEPGYRCVCARGFTGQKCTVNLDECADNATAPCLNGGVCVDTHGSFECRCDPAFNGSRCELDVDECAAAAGPPCRNNATCNNTHGSFECHCAPGFEGRHCDTDINECAGPDPLCSNSGSCVNTHGAFRCSCPPQFTGPTCADDVDECALDSKFCLNGGTCVNTNGGAHCACPPTYEGDKCERDVDECSRYSPCAHGTCTNREGTLTGYDCDCAGTGYRGVNCSTDIDECVEMKMKDTCHAPNGTCVNTPGAFVCNCTPPFTGPNCATASANCSTGTANPNLCTGAVPASGNKAGAVKGGGGKKSGVQWIVPLVALLALLVVAAVVGFFAYRHRAGIVRRLPASVRYRISSKWSGPTAHMNGKGDVDLKFGNPVYSAEGDEESSAQPDSDFNNSIYMSAGGSTLATGSSAQPDSEFDNSIYATPAGPSAPRGSAMLAGTDNEAYDPDGGEEAPYAALGSVSGPEEAAYAAVEGPGSVGSFQGSYVGPRSSLGAPPPPPRSPAAEAEGEAGEEDPYGYAELPDNAYSTLDRARMDPQMRRDSDVSEGGFPAPPPPLPPRGTLSDDDIVFEAPGPNDSEV